MKMLNGIDEVQSQISELVDYVTINPENGVLTIPMQGKKNLKVKSEVTGGSALEIVVTNPTVGCEIYLELTFTNGGAVTWTLSAGSTSKWGSGSAPPLTNGKRYRFMLFYASQNNWENFASSGV